MTTKRKNTSISGKVAIITGASGGIGQALAITLHKLGVNLTLTSRNTKKLKQVANNIFNNKNKIFILDADLRYEKAICDVFIKSQKHWGRLDILINNAAFGTTAPIHNGLSDVWKNMLDVNVLAVAIAMREALHHFNPKIGGQIINISSTSAHRVPPGGGFYAATKHAVKALSEVLRQELVTNGSKTRVCCISPGRVATNFFQGTNTKASSANNNHLDMLNPEDVAHAVTFQLTCPQHVTIQDIILRSHKQIT